MAGGTGATQPQPGRGDTVMLSSPDGRGPVVHLFPADPRLAADVRRVAESIARAPDDDDAFLEELEMGLRKWYPRLSIHAQAELASLAPASRVWYAMRDGRVHGEDPRIDRLHAALAAARDVTEDAGAAIVRSRSIRKVVLAGVDGAASGGAEGQDGA